MSLHKYHAAGDTGTKVPRPSFPSHAACSWPSSLMLPTRASFPRLPPLSVHTAIQPLLTKSESLKPISHALAHQMTNSMCVNSLEGLVESQLQTESVLGAA